MKNFPAASVEKFGRQKSKLLRRKILTNIIKAYITQYQRIVETYFEVKIQNHHVAEKC
jgi:polyhydroxyalkanoate synthesis regulator protein